MFDEYTMQCVREKSNDKKNRRFGTYLKIHRQSQHAVRAHEDGKKPEPKWRNVDRADGHFEEKMRMWAAASTGVFLM